ncbi:dephospho-CoA kinase [Prochlorococcus sp. AH-716-K03]|nr:dephospho-CoA kinase [Prochlorococcus sp. AH-716-K03]
MSIQPKLKNKQRRIGLTGGIASGKSTITNYIKKYRNIPILDADQYSKELIKPKSNCYEQVLAYFGPQIVDEYSSENAINRALLKEIIFENSIHRTWIQNLLHPLIKEKMIQECNLYNNNEIILLVIPLLFEAKFEDICTEIWLVKCTELEQIQRLVRRDKISEEEARKILKLQLTFEAKTEFSDVILDNSDDRNRWIDKVKDLI